MGCLYCEWIVFWIAQYDGWIAVLFGFGGEVQRWCVEVWDVEHGNVVLRVVECDGGW